MSKPLHEDNLRPEAQDEGYEHYVVLPEVELHRLHNGPRDGEVPILGPPPDRIIAECPGNADLVLHRCRGVLDAILRHSHEPWPTVEEWRSILPDWFVAQCEQEKPAQPIDPLREELYLLFKESPHEAMEFWRQHRQEFGRLAQERGESEDERWTVSGWVYWFEPRNRWWFWWDAAVQDADTLLVDVENSDWPYPAEAFLWLMKVAGATDARKEI